MQPYTYFLVFTNPETQEKKYYYGVQYAKNCTPDNFWKSYFTSSSQVKNLREQYGTESFSYQIRKIFDCPVKAVSWETKVIRRMKIVEKSEWLNSANFPVFISKKGKEHAGYRIPLSEDHKEKIRKTKKGKAPWPKGLNHPRRGIPNSKSTLDKIKKANSKTWLVTFPDGHSEIINNLNAFCKLNKLHHSHLSFYGKYKSYSAKAYKE